MKMPKKILLSSLCATLVASPAIAQQYQDGQQKNQRDANRASQQQDRSQNQSRRGSQQDPRLRVSPSGWIRVAADYDNDGTFDAIETLYVYDLERARQSSRQRANQDSRDMRGSSEMERLNNSSRNNSSRQARNMQGQSSSADGMRTYQQRRETVEGQIKNLRTQSMAGTDSKGVMARIETEQGRMATVCLGPQKQLNKLDLAEGDQITVEGVRGRVNDRTVLLARKVSSGDQQVDVQMPDARRLKRVRGEIVSKRNAKFRNQDEQHIVAKVRLISGKQETVNLGPKSKVEKLQLSQGDDVSLLVRPGRVNGQSALIAEQINTGDRTVEISTGRQFTSRSAQQSSTQQNRQQNRQQADQRYSRNENRDQRQMRREDQRQSQGSQSQDSRNVGQAALGIAVSDGEDGVKVEAIFPNSPAEKSKLREGDEIVSINGESIDSARQVIQTIQQRSPNEQLEIEANRDGETQTIRVRLADRSQLTRSRN